jgi:para-nitrobenzyl esterase
MARPALFIAALALALQACTGVHQDGSSAVRSTAYGTVAGNDDTQRSGTYSWKGVPYAAAPVGALRWRAPQSPERWQGTRAAHAFGNACVQTGRLYSPGLNNRYDETIGATLGSTVGSEDCLYLNIWTPSAPARAPRPVIVFVHGGSNITGYTADPVYDGAHLARSADAVVVSVNYRLGIFGFLRLEQLATGDPLEDSGNFALLDIVKALEFVQGNIANFGGNPRNVTLMGQSAGAVNVYALQTSPFLAARSTPLFHRVAALSGGLSTAATLPSGSIPGVLPMRVWSTRAEALLVHSLIAARAAPDEASARAYIASQAKPALAAFLRERTANELLTTVKERLTPLGMSASNPIPDGRMVATDPIAAVRAGQYVRVPVLAGNTRDETKLFPQLFALRPELGGTSGRLLNDAAVFALAYRYQPERPAATRIEDWIPPQYLPTDAPRTGYDARSDALNRIWFSAIRDDMLSALASRQREVWFYRFDWDELPAPFDKIFGAAHTFDLPFVFGNFGPSLYANISFTEANRRGREALSNAMMASVGAFARAGDPSSPALGKAWTPWPGRLVFDAGSDAVRISVD